MADDTPYMQQAGAQGDWRPIPDPTDRTQKELHAALKCERDYVDGCIAVVLERLRGIDMATKLLNETVNRNPTDVQRMVDQVKTMTDERFIGVQAQFVSVKNAVDIAFGAQSKAVDKAEVSTQKVIDGQTKIVDDLKDRITVLESLKQGGKESAANMYAMISLIATVLVVMAAFIGHSIH